MLTHNTGHLNLRRIEKLVKVLSDMQNSGIQIILFLSALISGTLPSSKGWPQKRQSSFWERVLRSTLCCNSGRLETGKRLHWPCVLEQEAGGNSQIHCSVMPRHHRGWWASGGALIFCGRKRGSSCCGGKVSENTEEVTSGWHGSATLPGLCDTPGSRCWGYVTFSLWHEHDFPLLILVTCRNRLPVFSSLVNNRECLNIYVRKFHSFLATSFLCIRNIRIFFSVLLWLQLITNTANRFLLLLWLYHDSPSIQMAWLL